MQASGATNTPPLFELRWDVPCRPAPDVGDLVGNATGRAEVRATGDEHGWTLQVLVFDPQRSQRQLEVQTCEQAAEAALLIVRIAARGQPAPRVPRRSPAQPVAAEPDVLAPSTPPRLSVALSAIAVQGQLPVFVGRVALSLGLRWASSWEALLALRTGAPVSIEGGPAPNARVVVKPILGGQLSACLLPSIGRLSVGPCAVASAAVWEVRGQNVTSPRVSSAGWLSAGLDARGALRLWEGLSLTLAVGARVVMLRPSASFQDSTPSFESSLTAAEGELGIRWVW